MITPWQKGQSGNPKGRPVRLFSSLAKQWQDEGYEKATADRVAEAYEWLLGMPLTKIVEIAGVTKTKEEDPENGYPIVIRMAAKELLGTRGIEIVETMLNRAQGRSRQQKEIIADLDLNVTLNIVKQYDQPDNDSDQETDESPGLAGR